MTGVRVSVLGPVEARRGADRLALGGVRQRSVLARLVVARGRVVGTDRLVEDVWDGDPPASAARTLHAYVSRLRRELGADAVERRGSGYRLNLEEVSLDLVEVEDAVTAGADAARDGEHDRSTEIARTALRAWRGAPFGDLAEEGFLAADLAALSRTRAELTRTLVDGLLALDRPHDAVPAAVDGWGAHPDREDLAAGLMIALARTGRQADALEVWDRTRRHLDAELGVRPGPELRAVHEAVLRQEFSAPPVAAAVAVVHPGPPPRLPTRNRRFHRRGEFLTRLETAVDQHGDRPRILVLHGLGGVGKTQIAIEAAHLRRAAGAWVGWVTAEDPTSAEAELVGLAGRSGLGPPEDPERCLAALHDHLARTHGWLLVLDNAERREDVEALLPPVGDGVVLLTSRNPAWRRLGDPLRVEVFDREESREFLAARVGAAPTQALEALAEACGDLPLAMEQACAYTESTGTTLTDYLEHLGAGSGAIRPHERLTWELSLRRVERDAAAARLLSVVAFLAPEAIPVDLLATHLSGADGAGARGDPVGEPVGERVAEAVAELLRYSLVDRDERGIRVHRLVQTAVRDRLQGLPRRAAQAEAVRVLRAAAPDPVHDPASWEQHERLLPHVLTLAGRIAEDVERTSLVSAPPGITDLLARTARYQLARAAYGPAVRLLETALALTGPTDALGTAALLGDLGHALDQAGDVGAALDAHRRALALLTASPAATPLATGRCLARLGRALHCAGRGVEAVSDLDRALALLRPVAGAEETAAVLTDLGYAQWAAHSLAAARRSFTEAWDLAVLADRSTGPAAAQALSGLGMVRQDLGDLEGALGVQQRVLALQTAWHGEVHPVVGETLDKLGYVLWCLGRPEEAVRTAGRAVDVLGATFGAEDPRTAMGMTNLGLPLLAGGHPERAVRVQRRALDLLERAYGAEHPHVGLTRRRLAGALLGLPGTPGLPDVPGSPGRPDLAGRRDEARDLLTAVLAQDTSAGPDRGRALGLLALTSATADAGAAPADAAAAAREAIELLEPVSAHPDPEVGALLPALRTLLEPVLQPDCNLAGAGSGHDGRRT